MSQPRSKIVPVEDLAQTRKQLREEGKTIVQCHGCFDIVHPGHIRYLRFASEQGDRLIVSVSADEAVGKGPDRPYIGQDLRMENLAALEFVDFVCLDENAWAGPILERLQPDIYVKGKEYERSSDPRFAREKEVVEGYGGKVIFSSGEVVYSSTFIISRFRERFALEQERVRSFCRRHDIGRGSLDRLMSEIPGKRVLVVGDPVLDHYVYCDAINLAAESPILNVNPLQEEWFLGAGALIAKQCAALGARATLLTLMGIGGDAERFSSLLESSGVEVSAPRGDDRPVYVKTRYLVDESKVFKVNQGRYAPLSTVAVRQVLGRLEDLAAEHDALIVTDFGYGFFGPDLAEGVCAACRRLDIPFYLDVSQNGASSILRFTGPRIATPTEEELRAAFSDRESGLSNLASRFYRQTEAERLVITLGKKGVVLFEPPEEDRARLASDYLSSLTQHPVDTVGAGDVFLAGLTLGDLAGADIAEGVYLASCAAALQVNQIGNEPVALIDLQTYLDGREELGE